MDNNAREMMRYFEYGHLQEGPLQDTSSWFYDLAKLVAENLPSNRETTACLRKLLEAKDCAVRSALDL